jgi:hypothetical protein
MIAAFDLTTTQKFELERMSRVIDATNDPVDAAEVGQAVAAGLARPEGRHAMGDGYHDRGQ